MEETQTKFHSFNLLPDDIWFCTIKHLDDNHADLSRLSQVSKNLYVLVKAYYHSLQTLKLEQYKARSIKLENLEPLFGKSPNVKHLDFTNKNNMNVVKRIHHDYGRIITDNCKNLTSLNVTRMSFAHSELLNIVTECSKISSLVLDYVILDDPEEMNQILDKTRSRLEYLSMRDLLVCPCGFRYPMALKPTGQYSFRTLALDADDLYNAGVFNGFVDLVHSSSGDLETLWLRFEEKLEHDQILETVRGIISKCPKLKMMNGVKRQRAALSSSLFSHMRDTSNLGMKHLDFDKLVSYSIEENNALKQLSILYRQWHRSALKGIQQCSKRIEWKVVKKGGTAQYYYVKIASLAPEFIQNVQPGNAIQFITSETSRNLGYEHKGIAMSKEDLELEQYDENLIYVMFHTNSSFANLLRETKTRVFDIVIPKLNFFRHCIQLESFIALRIFTDKFICDRLLSKKTETCTIKYTKSAPSLRDDDVQKQNVEYVLSQRFSLISVEKSGRASTVATLAHYLYETRSHKEAKILICADVDSPLEAVADRIYQRGCLKVVHCRPEYRASETRKSYCLDQLIRNEPPSNIDGLRTNSLTTFQLLNLNIEDQRRWKDYRRQCQRKILNESQIICCTLINACRLFHEESWIKFDSIILENSDLITEIDTIMIFQYLPRRMILVG